LLLLGELHLLHQLTQCCHGIGSVPACLQLLHG
jgi:hypothetical protein